MKNKIYALSLLLLLPAHNMLPIGKKRRCPSPSSPVEKRQLSHSSNDLFVAIRDNNLQWLQNTIENHSDRIKLLNTLPIRERLPLELACALGSKQVVLLLLKYGADPKKAACKNRTALEASIHRGSPNIVKLLLRHGAEATSPENHPSPLGLSVYLQSKNPCYYKIIKFLLQDGADPNQLDHSGRSPYIQAATTEQSQKLINLMHRYGANPLKLSREGKSALEYVSSAGNSEMAYAMEKRISNNKKSSIEDLLKEQQDDPITGDSLSSYNAFGLIILNNRVYAKQTLIRHVLFKIGTDNGPQDPFDRTPISKEILVRLAAYTKIPYQEIDWTQTSPHNQSLVAIARLLVPRESALSEIPTEAGGDETEEESDSDQDMHINELMQIGDNPPHDNEENVSSDNRQAAYDRETLDLIQAEVRTLQAYFSDRIRRFNPQLAESIFPPVLPNIGILD